MPRFTQHLMLGLATGAAVNAACQWCEQQVDPNRKFDWGELALCSLAGGVGGVVPDLLEPADHPGHRQFFHSLAMAGLVAYAASGGHRLRWTRLPRLLAATAAAGYLSHVLADSATPRSIPVI